MVWIATASDSHTSTQRPQPTQRSGWSAYLCCRSTRAPCGQMRTQASQARQESALIAGTNAYNGLMPVSGKKTLAGSPAGRWATGVTTARNSWRRLNTELGAPGLAARACSKALRHSGGSRRLNWIGLAWRLDSNVLSFLQASSMATAPRRLHVSHGIFARMIWRTPLRQASASARSPMR